MSPSAHLESTRRSTSDLCAGGAAPPVTRRGAADESSAPATPGGAAAAAAARPTAAFRRRWHRTHVARRGARCVTLVRAFCQHLTIVSDRATGHLARMDRRLSTLAATGTGLTRYCPPANRTDPLLFVSDPH
ncbi:hypothetical protein FJT64_013379 [Amphibalanus amphitrite]|uniref:Uncharacterized protein n=1 Tax=Amphibalanus amphitrite TaxID=1232801 RepID=A0A6A4VCS2_AMPAM|nr:hypothetical protein FJT64_013379 [Amphibalanus amphitrite]